MRPQSRCLVRVAGSAAALLFGACYATHHYGRVRETRDAGSGRSLVASLAVVAGEVLVHRAEPGVLYDLDIRYCRTHFAPKIAQEIAGEGAHLKAGLKRRQRPGDTSPARDEHNKVTLALSAETPTDLALDLGVGRHLADLGGLRLRKLRITSGKGSMTVSFDRPLLTELEELRITGGPGRLILRRLGNASPQAMTLSVASGVFEIDLGGEWRRDADIDLQVALGDVSLRLPRALNVELHAPERDEGDLRLPEFLRDDAGVYRGPGYRRAGPRIAVHIADGLGFVEAVIED